MTSIPSLYNLSKKNTGAKTGPYASFPSAAQLAPTGGTAGNSGTTAAAPSFAATTTTPGFTPDYAGLISSDPQYQGFLAANKANSVSDRAGLRAARQRAVTQFGPVADFSKLDPSLVGPDFQSDIDPATTLAAQNNPFSTQAVESKAHTNAIRALQNQLAATGRLGSGEAGYQLQNQNDAYGKAQYDAYNQFLDSLSGYGKSFATAEQGRQAQDQQARQTAATFQASLPQNQPVAGQTASFSHVDEFGNPVYTTSDGKTYGKDGTPYGGTPSTFGAGTPSTGIYGTQSNSPVPGYSPQVNNGNLATYLFGDPYNNLAGI